MKLWLHIYSFIFYFFEKMAKVVLFIFPRFYLLQRRFRLEEDLDLIKEERRTKERAMCFLISSAGEYEQALSFLDELRKDGDLYLILIFVSESGSSYAEKKGETLPCYLFPFDSIRFWNSFFKALGSVDTFFIRYELWPSFIFSAKKNGDIFLANASAPIDKELYLKKIFKKKLYPLFSQIFLVDNKSFNFFITEYKIPKKNLIVTGDTKYERVLSRKKKGTLELKKIQLLFEEKLERRKLILVAGSVWLQDIKVLVEALSRMRSLYKFDIRFICIPHKLERKFIEKIKEICLLFDLRVNDYNDIFLSSKRPEKQNPDLLILDKMGVLAEVYGLCDLAYVGGGLHSRVHNVLEPLAYGRPTAFGPFYQTSHEATKLIEANLAEVVRSVPEIVNWCSHYYDVRFTYETILLDYLNQKQGATRTVLKHLKKSKIETKHAREKTHNK